MALDIRYDRRAPNAEQVGDFIKMANSLISEKLPAIFNVEGRDRSITIEDATLELPDAGFQDYKAQLKAKINDADFSAPIRASFVMRDASGKVLSKTKPRIVMKLPIPTGRGTFIVGGNEYAVTMTKRQKPGVYTYHGKTGVQSVINTSTHQSPVLTFDPDNNKMTLKIGGRQFGLRSVMNILGVSDHELSRTWGHDIVQDNRPVSSQDKLVDRLYSTMLKYDPEGQATTRSEKTSRIKNVLLESKLDPWITNITMGKEYGAVSPGLMLAASRRMLDVNAGRVPDDNRDALHFQSFHGFDDSVLYGVEKESRKIASVLKMRLNNPNLDLDKVVSNPISKVRNTIRGRFTKSDSSSTPEQVNPLDMKANVNQVSSMGEGAIGSVFSVSDNMRQVDDSTMGFIDPVHTPTSSRMGVNQHLAAGVVRSGNDIYRRLFNNRTGKYDNLTPRTMYDKVVALPGSMVEGDDFFTPKGPTTRALHKGKIVTVKSKEVDYAFGDSSIIFDENTGLVPMISSTNPVRIATAVKQSGHALPLVEKELPLVRSLDRNGKNAEDTFAKTILTRVPSYIKNAKVLRVGSDSITLEDSDTGKKEVIQYYNDFPLNGETTMNETPIIKAGDIVKSGQPLASNDFIKDGGLALGRNLHIAFIPWKGLNYMDGLVVSSSASKKLAAMRQYRTEHEKKRNDIFDKKKFMAHNPTMFTKDQMETIDDNGIIKEGTIVTEGMPLMLGMKPNKISEDALVRGQTSKVFNRPFVNNAKTWDHPTEGVVKRVVNSPSGIKIYISTNEPVKRGDKISNRFYAKGVISEVIPDDEMPRNAKGEIVDIIQNPAAIMSRMNISQMLEASAAKLAKKTGQPYSANMIDPTTNEPRELMKKMKAANVPDAEKLFDKDGNEIASGNKIMTGYQYFTRQKQQAEKYYQARNAHDPYDVVSRRPIKGPKTGPLGFYSLIAHGATENLKELSTIQSEKNDDYWNAIEAGTVLPAPKAPFAFDKMQNFLKGAGIDIQKEGQDYRLIPMTDKQVLKMSSGQVQDPGKIVTIGKPGKFDTLQATPGGLYDRKLFGGFDGNNWGHIDLGDSIPNPTFERALRAVTGLKTKELEGLVDHSYVLTGEGKVLPSGEGVTGITGGKAFEKMLSKMDVDKELKEIQKLLPGSTGTNKNTLVKKARYLSGLKRVGMTPSEAYLMSKVPVLPAKFRPVYMGNDNSMRVSDFSLLYKDMGMVSNAVRNSQGLPSNVRGELYRELYDSVKALQVGTTGQGVGVKPREGILQYLKGSSPSRGHFMRNIFSKRRGVGGRAVVMPNPSLHIDQIGLPEDMAWTIMESWIMQKMTATGMPPLEAKRAVDDRTQRASNALDAVIRERPVVMTRDPKLHKFNTMAFMAKRVPGKAIEVPPLIVKGFNMDFDGDAASIYVPSGPKAVKEALTKMLPSRNLFKAGKDSVIMKPEEDTIAGIFAGTRIRKNTKQVFANMDAVMSAYDSKDLKLDDGVYVNGAVVSPGRILFNRGLPEELRDFSKVFDNKAVSEVLNTVANKNPNSYATILEKMKDNGDDFATTVGISFSLKDFFPMETTEIQKIRDAYSGSGSIDVPDKVNEQIIKRLKAHVNPNSAVALFADSGAKGDWGKVKQVLYSPMTMDNIGGGQVPHVLTTGYARGMDFEDYWAAIKGARKGMLANAVEVSEPGYFSKQLLRANSGLLIRPGDGLPSEGLEYSVDHPTVMQRYLAADVKTKDGRLIAAAGDAIDSDIINRAKASNIKAFRVRSPLTTTAADGMYARDFGRLPGNQKPKPGDDIGVISSHTLTEPATQLTLKAFHSAGAGGQSNAIKGLYAVWPLLNGLPPAGNKATMSPYAGKINTIKKLESGARKLTLDSGKVITTYAHSAPNVKRGDMLTVGQKLQDGYMDPKEVLKYRGLRPLQMYLVDEIEKNYDKNAPDRRYIEAVVAGLTRYGRVLDPKQKGDMFAGDVMTLNQLRDVNRSAVDDDDKIEYEPIFVGMDNLLPKVETDWAAKMMGSDMIRQLQDSAAYGLSSASSSPRPILPYIHGATFGDNAFTRGEY